LSIQKSKKGKGNRFLKVMELDFNQDGKDGRIDQDLDFEPGWNGWEDGSRLWKEQGWNGKKD